MSTINLHNFFRYYDPKNPNHVEAVEQLKVMLPPNLLKETSIWVQTYRKPAPLLQDQDFILPVPFYPQTDNYTQPGRTCNSSSQAMCLKYFKPSALPDTPNADDEYLKRVLKYGDSTSHEVQTKALNSFGLKSRFSTSLGFDDLDAELEQRRPVSIAILHRGTLDNPRGGHVLVVIGRKANGDYIVNDPYGELPYTGPVSLGRHAVYTRRMLESRWLLGVKNGGWGRTFQP